MENILEKYVENLKHENYETLIKDRNNIVNEINKAKEEIETELNIL